jgi:hypothetical protein
MRTVAWQTWGEFKRLVEEQGVRDEDEIFFIDVYPDNEIIVNRVEHEHRVIGVEIC